jgi:hypothetical protein
MFNQEKSGNPVDATRKIGAIFRSLSLVGMEALKDFLNGWMVGQRVVNLDTILFSFLSSRRMTFRIFYELELQNYNSSFTGLPDFSCFNITKQENYTRQP